MVEFKPKRMSDSMSKYCHTKACVTRTVLDWDTLFYGQEYTHNYSAKRRNDSMSNYCHTKACTTRTVLDWDTLFYGQEYTHSYT